MSTIDYDELENNIRNILLKCRRLYTRSVTDIPKYSTINRIQKNYPSFIRELFKAHKTALKILTDEILRLENLISKSIVNNSDQTQKIMLKKLKYWKRILELAFNTFVWINLKMDRSNVRKVFKGPKFGDISHQNIDSVLSYVKEVNKAPYEIAIPLDFCSFSPICDILKISYSKSNDTLKRSFIEAKSGKVNEEMLETLASKNREEYFKFFDKYGEKGIKQMERFFRQSRTHINSKKLIDAKPGIYQNPENPEEPLMILSSESKDYHFSNKIAQLLDKADRKEFAVSKIDNCLAVGAINTEEKKFMLLGEYDLRLYVYHSFINPKTLNATSYPQDLAQILRELKLTDWREGFSSVVLEPITLRLIPDQYIIDLLLGKKILKFSLSPQKFIDLCKEKNIEAKFTSKKESNRMRSSGSYKGLVDFDGKFIQLSFDKITLWLGEGTLHDMLFNWRNPSSVIEKLKQVQIPHIK